MHYLQRPTLLQHQRDDRQLLFNLLRYNSADANAFNACPYKKTSDHPNTYRKGSNVCTYGDALYS
jgi:hypothetical protein